MGAAVTLGREMERRQLLAAIEDPSVRAVALRGAPGEGKTALALDTAQSLRGALVGYGKHAEDSSGQGLRAFGDALRGALEAGLAQLYDAEIGLSGLRAALGASAPALKALDPDLFDEIAPGPAPPLSSGGAVERISLAVTRLLTWLEGFEAPIVLVLDDWGRAGPATLQLYRRLAADAGRPRVTLIATERDSEPGPAGAASVITLGPVNRDSLLAIAAARLDGDQITAAAVLADAAPDARTPLDVVQALSGLTQTGALRRTPGGWSLDKAAAALSGPGAATVLVRRCAADRPDVTLVLHALAVGGDGSTPTRLAAVAGLSAERVAAALAVTEGAGLTTGGRGGAGTVALSHDTVRAAVVESLDGPSRRSLAGRWAEHLAATGALQGPPLETALRLRLEGGLAEAGSDWVPRFVAGAVQSRTAGASAPARLYASAALELEGADAAAFAVAREAALSALQDGDLEAGAALAALMAERAQGEEERLLSAEASLLAARLSGRMGDALRHARSALAEEGLATPERVRPHHMIADLVRLRLTPDRPKLGPRPLTAPVYRVMNTAGYLAFEQDPNAAVVLAARAARFGPIRGSAYAAGLRATLSCLTGDWTRAVAWGRKAHERLTRDEPMRAPALHLTLQFGIGLELDGARQFAEAGRLQALALEEGDLGMAAYGNRDRALASMRRPITLSEHRATLAQCRALADRLEDPATTPLISALDQMAHNLAEGGTEPWRLRGDIFDSPRFDREAGPEGEGISSACLLLEAALANAFGAWETTAAVQARMGDRFDRRRAHPWITYWTFQSSLARARLGLPARGWERRVLARHARINPRAFGHCALALRAETELRAGRLDQAMATYAAALGAVEASDNWLDAGIVPTAALAAARSAGREAVAERFYAAQQRAWLRLGAMSRVEGDAPCAEAPPPEAAASPHAVAVERALGARTQLLAEAAHELRTPMQGIQGLLDLAADDAATLDVARVRTAFAGLRSVVDDLTDFGAVEGDRLSIVESAFRPVELVRTEITLAAPEAARLGRPLRLETDADQDGAALGDGSRIAQILRNLISNALRYGDGGVVVRFATSAGELLFDVRDHGPGLSQADLTRLFQPFTRGDAAARAGGSGLGLALSRRLAERMGGALEGANAEGGGARFTLRLPWAPVVSPLPARAAAALRVLLAEDVDLSRDTLVRLLEGFGHEVVAAADGEAALAAGSAEAFDVWVFDARMPGLGGAAVLERLRALGLQTPAVVLTAAPSPELARDLQALQPVRLARKPIPAGELQALLAAVTPAPPEALDPALAAYAAKSTLALAGADLAGAREAAHAAAGLAAQFGRREDEALFALAERAAEAGDAQTALGALTRLSAACRPAAPLLEAAASALLPRLANQE